MVFVLLLGCGILPVRGVPESLAYILQADAMAPGKTGVVKALAELDRDWIVLDAFYKTDARWAKADVEAIRAGKAGRKVIAYISVGEAEDYRPYWKEKWNKVKPEWLGRENPDWEGNYIVDYWHPEWQAIILKSIDAAMASGFDGIYLDIVNGFETFEKKGNRYIDNRKNPETGQSYRRDMVDWVKRIAARARVTRADALVIPQNGAQLLAHADFRKAVSGIGIEDLFTYDNKLQPAVESDYVIGFLDKLTGTGKPVVVIEYANKKNLVETARRANEAEGYTWLFTNRALTKAGVSGN